MNNRSNLVLSLTQKQMEPLVNLILGFFTSLGFFLAYWHNFTSQSNVCVFTQVASQIRVHSNVISSWVARHTEQGPPSGDREHFISHWHVHLYPHHPAEGCWGCQPWGNERGTQNVARTRKLHLWPQSKAGNKIAGISPIGKVIHVVVFQCPRSIFHAVLLQNSPRNYITLK